MPYKLIYSRQFYEKVFTWAPGPRDMAFQAAEHAALDPNHHEYHRDYFVPYKQKKTTTNHQYVLFFLILSPTELFFTWVNDPTCLHDTRANYPDPCRKEFDKRRGRNEIEIYDPQFHNIIFEVHPDNSKPIRCRSRFLGHETLLNTYPTGTSSFIGHSFSCDEPNNEIAKIHVIGFLNELHALLTTNTISFEFALYKQGHQNEIALLTHCYDHNKWDLIPDNDDFILRKK